MSVGEVMLSVRDLSISYGAIQAVSGISFDVQKGAIVTMIGANGAGKSSILRAISGMIPYSGGIIYEGRNIKNVAADKLVELGITHVPEGRGIFGNLTIRENLKLATWKRRDSAGVREDYEKVFAIFPRLKERLSQFAGTLSGGEQQMLAVARAMMSRGRLILLDEPSMGLSPVLVREIFRIIEEINKSGTTILLVEQNAFMALRIAGHAHVLETGSIVQSGPAHELLGNPAVKKAYLGG